MPLFCLFKAWGRVTCLYKLPSTLDSLTLLSVNIATLQYIWQYATVNYMDYSSPKQSYKPDSIALPNRPHIPGVISWPCIWLGGTSICGDCSCIICCGTGGCGSMCWACCSWSSSCWSGGWPLLLLCIISTHNKFLIRLKWSYILQTYVNCCFHIRFKEIYNSKDCNILLNCV